MCRLLSLSCVYVWLTAPLFFAYAFHIELTQNGGIYIWSNVRMSIRKSVEKWVVSVPLSIINKKLSFFLTKQTVYLLLKKWYLYNYFLTIYYMSCYNRDIYTSSYIRVYNNFVILFIYQNKNKNFISFFLREKKFHIFYFYEIQ